MGSGLVWQIRVLQFCVALLVKTGLSGIYCVPPFFGRQKFKVIHTERINIREKRGTRKAVLSNAAGFKEGSRPRGGRKIFG
jgi:hypothetical protein